MISSVSITAVLWICLDKPMLVSTKHLTSNVATTAGGVEFSLAYTPGSRTGESHDLSPTSPTEMPAQPRKCHAGDAADSDPRPILANRLVGPQT